MYCGPPHQLSQALCSGELAGMCPWALGLQCLSWSGSLYFSTLPIQWYIASLTTLLLGLKLFRGLLLIAQQSKNLWNHLQSLPHAWALLHNSHPEGTLLCLQLLSQCQPFHASVTQHAAFPAGCTCFLFSCLPNLLILKIPINYRFQGNLSRASWQG